MTTKDKGWVLVLFVLAGLVIGGLLGEIASRVEFLWWLAYGQEFGLSNPLQVDLGVIKFAFSIMLRINIASIIGMTLAIFIFRSL